MPPSQVWPFMLRSPPVLPPRPGPIVAGEEHQRLLVQFQLFQAIENLTNAPIQLGHDIAIQSGAGAAVKVGRRRQRLMRHGVGQVQEERAALVVVDEF